MTYEPKPVDTNEVVVPSELTNLVEQLAENVHEVWAKERMAQGWTYGETRNDTLKHHPCLVPYSDLTEEERQYDRNTAMETVKLILKLGFKVSAPKRANGVSYDF